MADGTLRTAAAGSVNVSGGTPGRGRRAANPTNDQPTGATGADIAAAAKALPETFDNDVYTDELLIAETDAVKAAFDRADANVIAVANGPYASNSTWWNTTTGTAVAPTANDKVLIPVGFTVTYDRTTGANETWIRVDGTLNEAATGDLEYTAETIFIDHTGRFQCGTAASPIPGTRTITFKPHATGDLDVANDPFKFTRGMVCLNGEVEIHGQDKVHMARASAGLSASATTVTLDTQVVGGSVGDWEVGDVLEITGTRIARLDSVDTATKFEAAGGWKQETVTISSINNSSPTAPVITFTPALTYDHPACHIDSTLTPHVINKTRNIRFQTDATNVWQRPHNLFKSNDGIDISWVNVTGYGRTDHNINLSSSADYGPYDNDGFWGSRNQSRGDSPFLAPRFVMGKLISYTGASPDFSLRQSWNSAGGVRLNSSSGGTAKLSAVNSNGDGTGTLLVTEVEGTFADGDTLSTSLSGYGSGTQSGAPAATAMTAKTNVTGRYALHVHRCGYENPAFPAAVFTGCVVDDVETWAYTHHDSHAKFDRCIAVNTLSVGFAAEGGGNIGEWVDCFVCGTKTVGDRPASGRQRNGGSGNQRTALGWNGYWMNSRSIKLLRCGASGVLCGFLWDSRGNFRTNAYPGSIATPRIWYGLAESADTYVDRQFPPIEQFKDCEAYNCYWGIIVNKGQPNQNHDKRSLFENFTCWEWYNGVDWLYTGHYTLLNAKLYGMESNPSQNPSSADLALRIDQNAADIVVNQADIQNCAIGIQVQALTDVGVKVRKKHLAIEPSFTDVAVHYQWKDLDPQPFTPPVNIDGATYADGAMDFDYKTVASLGSTTASFAPYEDEMVWDGARNFVIVGDITDSTGTYARHVGQLNPALGRGMILDSQDDGADLSVRSTSSGLFVQLKPENMEELIRQEGVWTSTAGDKVLLIPDVWGDRSNNTLTEFYTPVALRIPTAQYNAYGATENGTLATHGGVDFSAFQPAGTPGLT